MAINSFNTWITRSESPDEQIHYVENGFNTLQARLYSLFTSTPFAGVVPTTATVPSRTITGAFGQKDGVGNLCLGDFKFQTSNSIGAGGLLILFDRLSHQGGLDATVITAQTTNLPTAALTRYTNGQGVIAMLEIYTQIGATATTITVSYTNQAGTAAQISQPTVFGGTAFREVGRIIPIPLALGDTGIRSVENVTVLASTLTAGNFGITLYKPIMAIPIKCDISASHFNALIQSACHLVPVLSGACLHFGGINSGSGFGTIQGVMNLIDA